MFWTAMMWTAGIIVGVPVGILLCKLGKQVIIGALTLLIWACDPLDRWIKRCKKKKNK
jgi:hypothetical protein